MFVFQTTSNGDIKAPTSLRKLSGMIQFFEKNVGNNEPIVISLEDYLKIDVLMLIKIIEFCVKYDTDNRRITFEDGERFDMNILIEEYSEFFAMDIETLHKYRQAAVNMDILPLRKMLSCIISYKTRSDGQKPELVSLPWCKFKP